jgi:hypothetical protein
MTTFTLITGFVFVLGAALLSAALVLAFALLWTARRVGDSQQFQGQLDSIRTEVKNLDDFLESYRKRDAQRVSTIVQRAKKNGAQQSEVPPFISEMSRDDLVKAYDER